MQSLRRYLFITLGLVTCLLVTVRLGQAAAPPVVINEILVGNAGTNIDPDLRNFSSWIELRNTTGKAVNLQNYTLESWPDDADTPDTVTLPKLTVPANGYLLLWADETKGGIHLPIELDMDGGELRLTAPNGDFDHVDFANDQSMDVSYGRAGSDWAYFDQPTPGKANTTPGYPDNDEDEDFAAVPDFSVGGGLHMGPISVELSSETPGATIRYTTDGSRPTAASTLYTAPIPLSEITVLRARAWADGLMVSPTATETYLLDVSANLPVVSLVTDDANLFDSKIGIYAGGSGTPNWNQRWERPANIEFYELTAPDTLEQEINQEIGLEISGARSRKHPQKSFEIKSRKTYGDNRMDYPFFDDKPMESYRRLVLRNGGNDIYQTHMRDAVGQAIATDFMNLDRQAYRPVAVYLNGVYWGLYNLHEKADEDLVENNYGLDSDEFDTLEISGKVNSGNNIAWLEFFNYVKKNKPSDPAVYEAIQQEMDIHSFIDYIILETFVANYDWPLNNTRWWNDYDDDYGWRWILRDLDRTFIPKKLKMDMIAFTLKGKGPTGTIFKQLWLNADFRNEFAQRYATHLNTTFQPARLVGIIDHMADEVRAEIPAHSARWGKPTPTKWEDDVAILRQVAAERPHYARETLRKRIGKPGDATLTIHTIGDGEVLVAGAAVSGGYSGPHFRNIPMTLTAVPAPGQQFVRWEETGETTASITIPFTADTTRTAVFEEEPPPPPPPNLVINELHHTPPVDDNTYEFLEIYNADDETVDLSGYWLDGVTFTFPNGASIAPGEYIVVADTPTTYTDNGYQVFDFDGGLSSSGEAVTLFDALNREVDKVDYGVADPWPSTPNAGGPSLSLLDPSLDNSLAGSWAASLTDGGTPGAANFPAP